MRIRLGLGVLLAAALFPVPAGEPACAQEIPFDFREGLIWIKVRVPASAEPLNFLLDSGANVSVLNLRTAQRLGLRLGHRVSVEGVGATSTGYWPQHLAAQADQISLPAEYLAVDLSELSGACACPVDGLIGAGFFSSRVVGIDFAERKIRLLPASRPTEGQKTLPLKVRNGALRVQVRVNDGAPQWLRLDTGCASSLHWVTRAAPPEAPEPGLAVALTKISVPVAPTTVQLDGLRFEGVPTGLHTRPIFAGEAGLLGNGLLSQLKSVTIDTRSGRVLLQPRQAVN